MRAIGIFRELEPARVDAPSIFASAGKLSREQAQLVASYLSDGEPIIDAMEAVPDPFSPSTVISGGSGLMATARFVFRQDLPVLVERHCVGVDPDVLTASAAIERLSSSERASLAPAWRALRELYYSDTEVKSIAVHLDILLKT